MAPAHPLRLQRQVEHLCRLGPRSVVEALAEIERRSGNGPIVRDVLAEYERVTPAMIEAAGARGFPPYRPRLVLP